MDTFQRAQQQLEKIRQTLDGRRRLLILLQDNPDPDAIAAAAALRFLANSLFELPCSLVHGGIVGRAENKALVRYLGLKLNARAEVNVGNFDAVALVDTQPGTGNNLLPGSEVPDIVIDHHPVNINTRRAAFTDVRSNYGATSTILYEYVKAANLELSMPLSTALLYGIRSDTLDLGREAAKADIEAFLELYPLANKRMLATIINATVPPSYFQTLADALVNARLYGQCLVADLGQVTNPDMIAEVADLLLRHEQVHMVMCFGVFTQTMRISLRGSDAIINAGELIRKIVGAEGSGGGHDTYAGGQVPLLQTGIAARQAVARRLRQRFCSAAGVGNCRGKRLVMPA